MSTVLERFFAARSGTSCPHFHVPKQPGSSVRLAAHFIVQDFRRVQKCHGAVYHQLLRHRDPIRNPSLENLYHARSKILYFVNAPDLALFSLQCAASPPNRTSLAYTSFQMLYCGSSVLSGGAAFVGYYGWVEWDVSFTSMCLSISR